MDSKHAAFPLTRTTLVQLAADPQAPGWREAWERFFRGYWPPLYAWLRRTGTDSQEALDLLQGFFVHGLEGKLLAGYDSQRGRLRSFLLTCLANHRKQAWRSDQARPDRLAWLDADAAVEPTADDPEQAFGRDWNRCLIDQAVADVRGQLADDALGLALLERWVLAPARPDAETVAGELGITRSALYTRATRLRRALTQATERRLRFLNADPQRLAAERDAVLRAFRGQA